MIPADLADILEKTDEEDITVSILHADFQNKDARFKILVSGHSYEEEEFFQYEWTIETVNYRTSKIMFDRDFHMKIMTDDALLWRFSDIQSELYFNGYTDFTQNLFFELYQAHYNCYENLEDFQETIYSPGNFERLRQPSAGLMAKGPNKLMKLYGQILKGYGINFSIVGERMPTFWNGSRAVDEDGKVKVLFIAGAYIIADEFIFKNKLKR